MPSARVILLALFAGGFSAALPGQQPVAPERQVGVTVAASTDSIASLGSVRPLSDGRVLINDTQRRRLILLDAALQHPRVLADTTAATNRAYGSGLSGMVPFA